MVKISIIIPTYRPGKYLYECLKSIQRQQEGKIPYCYHLFIVLNGDKEPYYNILEHYIKELHLNASLIYTEEKGVSNARNIGIDLSQNYDYLTFVDDDDLLADNFLAALLAVVEDKHSFAQSRTLRIRADGSIDPNIRTYTRLQSISKRQDSLKPLLFRARPLLNSVWSKLIPISLIKDNRFNKHCAISEDSLFMFALSRDIKQIKVAEDTIYYINERENSVSRKPEKAKRIIHDSITFIKALTSVYISSPRRYSFSLYLSRVVASLLFLLERLKRNRTKSNPIQ
jgi:putative glycosyltransferase protein